MANYNPEESSKSFYKGKLYLDSGRFREAIEEYTKLIAATAEFKDEDALLILEVSHNNLGMALCKLGLRTNNKEMYLKGVENFKRSISYSKLDKEKEWLTAYHNLKFSEKEIQEFEKPENWENNFFRSI